MLEEPWRITLLGGLRAQHQERIISRFRTQKTGALLAFLAYHRGKSHSREVLCELFWPDTPEESARHSLSIALSSLRSQFEPPGAVAGSVIVADKLVVELNPGAFTTDVQQYEDSLRSAALSADDEHRASSLSRAVDLYGGALLPGYYEEWIAGEQERLAERFLNACHELVSLLARSRKLREALEIARRAAAVDALREAPQRDVIRLLVATGQPAEALRQYRELERRLAEELGESPAPATRQLFRQIEEQVGSAELVAPAAAPARPRPPGPSFVRRSSSLPTGTVTFLLTDIEGSTARWERAGDAFRQALAVHHRLLRQEFRRAGGHEAKEAGDSFLVAFASASDALACAVACQRALAGQVWPEGAGPVRARMALHTGDVALEDGEYHGLPLHRASRMLDTGHGGQILCSEATASLLRRDLEPEVSLTELGVFRLRGVEEPERLYQVTYPGMPQREFPPLRAERGFAARLPLQLTRFFGREKEIARIAQLLTMDLADTNISPAAHLPSSAAVRLVTLTGPGGTGKTRLAIEAAGRMLDHYDGAIWFVPLAELSDARLVPNAIHDAMRLPRSSSTSPMDEVVGALMRQPSLLVLDNLEQVVDGAAESVQDLLSRVPALSILATSRQVLGLEGERELAVEPLPVPGGPMSAERLGLYESVRLFVDRAQAVKPDFQVTNGNAPAVAELCARLEGIPLAIELAAARASVLSPTQMLYQLGNRFDFLVSRRRGVAERQRTLRSAVDWSYRLLSPDLQRFFARLSVFRGGCTVESAESVCEEPLALDALAQLRESSLVLTETCETCGRIRFRLLESLREYAWERLSPEEGADLERRHADRFLTYAEQAEPYLTGPDQATWLAHLDAEHDNFRAVLAWCDRNREHGMRLRLAGALWRFWSVRGYFSEGRRALTEALEPTAGESAFAESPALALALAGAGALAHDLGDLSAAEGWLREAAAIYGKRADRRGLASTANLLANVALDQDDYERARGLYEEALDAWRELGDTRGQAMALSNLGALAQDSGESDRAAELLEESVRLKRSLGNPYGLAISLDTLGNVERSRGNLEKAVSLCEEALAIRRDLGHRQGVAMSLCNLGSARLERGETEPASAHLLESLDLFGELEDVRGSLECLSNLAGLAAALRRHEDSARLLGAVAALRESMGIQPSAEEQSTEGRVRDSARTAIGDKRFDRGIAEGRNLTLPQVRELARGAGSGQRGTEQGP